MSGGVTTAWTGGLPQSLAREGGATCPRAICGTFPVAPPGAGP